MPRRISYLIKGHAPLLRAPEGINPCAILFAVYDCEKYNEANRNPRFEPAYAPDGIYYLNSAMVRDEYGKWGDWAACSFSNFQILYIVARELGYDGPPLALDHDSVAIHYVVEYINRRIFDKPGIETVENVADAYNSGTYKDNIVPEQYIAKFVRQYEWHKERECLPSTTNNEDDSLEE